MITEFHNVDCMEYMKNLGGGSVDMVLTDIPYDGVNKTKESGLRVMQKGKADEITFNLHNFLTEVYRIAKSNIVIFCGQEQFSRIISFFFDKQDIDGDKISVRQLVWAKSNPSPMNGEFQYLSGAENAVWVKKAGGTFNAFCKSNVLVFPCGSSDFHPTEKNHKLLADLIADNSNVGDLIFDPCAGSGSTLLVAYQMGRQFIGCELDKEFYEKAKKRLDAETQQITIWNM